MTVGFTAPLITEFMADNASSLTDEDGEYPDWIEIHNPDEVALSLADYHLTDNPENLSKWRFPAVNLSPGAHLVVFASGKNRDDSESNLHTNFQLSAEGEFLALVSPDEMIVASIFTSNFPAQFEDESYGLDLSTNNLVWNFYSIPTPGESNRNGTRAGPVISVVEPNPAQPDIAPLTVSALVHQVNAPVATVTLHYRKMFEPETMLPMNDQGRDGDSVAGDSLWTAMIPSSAFAPAEMTRWRFVAADAQDAETKAPSFRDQRDSHQYIGTVPHDPEIHSSLHRLHWFTNNAGRVGSTSGSRGAIFFNGEFYDNVLFTRHGQSTAGFPKKSYNIDFNRTHRFLWDDNAPRVADIDLLTNWADKSKVRHVLAYEVMRESGVAAHFAQTVRVQQNGRFFSTADLVEDADKTYLERAGLNKDGALYKVYSNTLNQDAGDRATSGVEKKTRKFENNNDLHALINGLDLRGPALSNYLYDNIDIPSCVNMLAANSVIRNIDMHSKNWYIYRDSGQSDEWAILPWDLDLSQGRVWNRQNTYFDNRLYTDGFVVSGTSIRLVSHLFGNREIRSMIMRRIRTLADRFLQPPPAPGTPENELFYERRLNEQSLLIDPPTINPSDAQLDFEKWGSWLQRGASVPYTNSDPEVETMAEAIERWKTEYLPARRHYIYNRQLIGRGGEIPLPQTGGGPTTNYFPLVANGAIAKVFVPTNDTLGDSWTGHPSSEPFDTSDWLSGPTGIGYDQGSAYDSLIGLDIRNQMRRNTSVYIRIDFDVTDPTTINQLELRVKYDDGFVAFLNGSQITSGNAPDSPTWNSSTRIAHPANPRRANTFNVSDKRAHLRKGRNVLAIQGFNDKLNSTDLLIAPELYAGTVTAPSTLEPVINFGVINSSPSSGNQDEEFIQLVNPNSIAVDISNWQLSGGIKHVFTAGTVLAPNVSLYVCPNVAAFRARSFPPRGSEGLFVQGGYQGHLSSFGETLTLLDGSGTVNNSTAYSGEPSDTQRYLVMSELMYHPINNNFAEYVELLNISSSTSLNLDGVRFTQGVEFSFEMDSNVTLAPGARVLIVRDLVAFEKVYGPKHPVVGVFANGSALSNGGERIKLEDPNNGTILDFAYDDQAPWPKAADQAGYSLVLVNPQSRPDPTLSENWRASLRPSGSPGTADNTSVPGDPSSDLNNNGEADLIDYALGNDLGLLPLIPRFRWETDELLLEVPISLAAKGVEILPSFSRDLVDWQDGASQLEVVSTEPLGDGRAMRVWRIKAPLRNQTQLFMRLRVVEQ